MPPLTVNRPPMFAALLVFNWLAVTVPAKFEEKLAMFEVLFNILEVLLKILEALLAILEVLLAVAVDNPLMAVVK